MEWSHLLDRSRSVEAAAVWRRAVLTAPRGRLTLAAALRSTRPGDRLRIAAGVHAAPLLVPHALEISAEPGAVVTGPITLMGSGGGGGGGSSSGGASSSGGGASSSNGSSGGAVGRRGLLRGLRVEHFYETAVSVQGGHWTLEQCEVCSAMLDLSPCSRPPLTSPP